jgi:hypothetical protein
MLGNKMTPAFALASTVMMLCCSPSATFSVARTFLSSSNKVCQKIYLLYAFLQLTQHRLVTYLTHATGPSGLTLLFLQAASYSMLSARHPKISPRRQNFGRFIPLRMTTGDEDGSLQRLVDLPGRRYILVGGKGGVGKTSTSSALAIRMAGCPFLPFPSSACVSYVLK